MADFSTKRFGAGIGLLLLLLLFMMCVGLRIAGHSDLYDNDQPKTVAYTADIVLHGHWLLPHDNLPHHSDAHQGRPATKPPLYNWVGATAVKITGRWDEWVLKMPSLLGGLMVLLIIVKMGDLIMQNEQPKADSTTDQSDDKAYHLFSPGQLAALLWLGCYATSKLIYTARPDMILIACLVASWATGTILILKRPIRGEDWRVGWQIVFWISVAGAALAKGAPAVLPVAYIIVGSKLIAGKWSQVFKTGIVWGLPLAVLLFGGWAYGVYQVDPHHFKTVLVGDELVNRVSGNGFWKLIRGPIVMPLHLLRTFAPWSIFLVLSLTHMPVRQWFKHTLGPVFLWIFLAILLFSFSGSTRADYIAPAIGPAAIAAMWWLIVVAKKFGVTQGRLTVVAILIALGMFAYSSFLTSAGKTRLGDHVTQFANQVRMQTGDEPIIFNNTGYNPLQTLLGQHQHGKPTETQRQQAPWIIQQITENSSQKPVIISQLIPEVRKKGSGRIAAKLGLYRNQFYGTTHTDPPENFTTKEHKDRNEKAMKKANEINP